MEKKSDKVTWKEAARVNFRAFREISHYCPGVFTSVALHSIVSAVAPYLSIWFSAQIINELATLRRSEVLWKWVAMTVITGALASIATGLLGKWKNAMEERLMYRRHDIFADKLLAMDYVDVDRTELRALRSHVSQNENWGGYGYLCVYWHFGTLVGSVIGILSAVTLTVSLFTQSVPESAGWPALLNHPAFVLLFVVALLIPTVLSPMCSTKADSYFVGFDEEIMLGNRIFTAFGFLSRDKHRALDLRMYNQQEVCNRYLDRKSPFSLGGKADKLQLGPAGLWGAMSGMLSSILIGMVYLFVCLKAWGGAFGVGSVTQYVGAVTALTSSLSSLFQACGGLYNNTQYMKIAHEYLDTPNNMYQGSLTTEKRADRQYDVEFRNVSFQYPGSEKYALRNVNMKFKVGNRLAVVGENGSGKTTFIKLLCRLYDPTEGQILLNGIDIRKYNYRDYMDIFSVVFQDFQLISQPLGANVAGAVTYDREKVQKALVDAGFGDRLATLDKGLDTMLYRDLSDEGIDVSGGEAQKIAIARALYKDAPFIILDEPTAALDPIAEAEIYSKFNDIAGDKTAIYISHRLSSCKFCDEIAVFHRGDMIQQGSHDTLLADKDGKYYELWNAQAQYYTEKTA